MFENSLVDQLSIVEHSLGIAEYHDGECKGCEKRATRKANVKPIGFVGRIVTLEKLLQCMLVVLFKMKLEDGRGNKQQY